MWGLFAGMLIGGLQILAVSKLGRMMLEGKTSMKIIGFTLFILKMGAIVAILYLISTVSLEHLIWTAGGMLLGLSAVSLYMLKRRRRAAVSGEGDSND
jgi:hypothetical protein